MLLRREMIQALYDVIIIITLDFQSVGHRRPMAEDLEAFQRVEKWHGSENRRQLCNLSKHRQQADTKRKSAIVATEANHFQYLFMPS